MDNFTDANAAAHRRVDVPGDKTAIQPDQVAKNADPVIDEDLTFSDGTTFSDGATFDQ